MITIQEFMDCYNAAKEGKQIRKITRHRGYVEDYYDYEDVDFLNLPLSEIITPNNEDGDINFDIQY